MQRKIKVLSQWSGAPQAFYKYMYCNIFPYIFPKLQWDTFRL